MDQSNEETASPLSRLVLGLVAAIAGSLILAWFTFLVWLIFKAVSLL